MITAVLSSAGGSFYILTALQDNLDFYINEYVLEEAMTVLDEKFGSKSDLKNKLFLLIGLTPIKVMPNPPRESFKKLIKILNKKDIPVLVSALGRCSYFITLDNDFLTEKVIRFAKDNNVSIVKPKDFIRMIREFD